MTNEAVNNDIQAAEQLSQLPAEAVKLSAVTTSISLNNLRTTAPSTQSEPTPSNNSSSSSSPQESNKNQ